MSKNEDKRPESTLDDELDAELATSEMTDEELAAEEMTDEELAAAEGTAPAAKKDKTTQLAELVELGRSKGKLTDQEIMDAMELFDFDPEQMDKL